MAHARHTRFTVILAERNRHVRDLLAREFTQAGFSVKSCGFGREAVSLAREGGDVLVVDGELPDMDPAGIVRQVRCVRPGLPVAVHAHEPEEAGKCLSEALVFFVEKSGDPEGLIGKVREVLGATRTGEE